LVVCSVLALAALVAGASAAPACHWTCDDPVCAAVCVPVCAAPVCTVPGTALVPRCTTRCAAPPSQSPADTCPVCETVCTPLTVPGHTIECAAPQCAWSCRKPHTGSECAAPRCELQCEQPACAANMSTAGNADARERDHAGRS
jgi:hypothetical protein